jgi:hypothetical protein
VNALSEIVVQLVEALAVAGVAKVEAVAVQEEVDHGISLLYLLQLHYRLHYQV